MKRIQLFEFEDLPWLPGAVRAGVTNLIAVFHRLMGTAEVVAELVSEAHRQHPFTQVVDLGSGSGGPMPAIIQKINERRTEPIHLLLTDLHPDASVVRRFGERRLPHVRYHAAPVDATDLGALPAGLKTMVASFHHLRPATARAVLRAASKHRQPLLIYEVAKNNVPVGVWWALLPLSLSVLVLMAAAMTPFSKPLSLRQLLLTYLLPAIPAVYAWDGQASLVRTYTFDDLRKLLGDEPLEGYRWQIDDARRPNGKRQGYYVLGLPTGERGKDQP